MDLTRSVQKAQNPAVCEFCDSSSDIKWKCVNCNLFLCDECKTKIHRKIKPLEEHDVIAVKDFGTFAASETIRKADLSNIKCSSHSSENCIIYCRDCTMVLCSSCLSESHNGHKFDKIDHVYQKKLSELQELDAKIDQDLTFVSEHEDKLKKMRSEKLVQYNEIKQTILQKEKDIKEEASKRAQTSIQELNDLWKSNDESISKEEKKLKEHKDDLKQRKSKIEEAFFSHEVTSIFTTCDQINLKLPKISVQAIQQRQFIYLPVKTTGGHINLGSLIKIPELKISKTYQSGVPDIAIFKTFLDRKSILFCYPEQTLKTLALEGSKCITTNIVKKVDIYDMAFTGKGILLLTIYGSYEIKYLSADAKLEIFTSVHPLYARGIHATDKNIILGFSDDKSEFPLTEKGRRGIMILDMEGRHMRSFEYDTDNERLFSLPRKLTTNVNNDICVIDLTSNDWNGRLVTLGELGQKKWIYNGHSSINSKSQFTPCAIVTTVNGLVIVADRDSNAIHMLTVDGDLVKCFDEQYGISRPFGLNIDTLGQLQICCGKVGTKRKLSQIQIANLIY